MPTNVVALNAYEIDGQPFKTASAQLFASDSQVLPYFGNNPALYSIVIGSGDGRHYAVVQTVAALQTLFNT